MILQEKQIFTTKDQNFKNYLHFKICFSFLTLGEMNELLKIQ